jgi:cupin fold WbuC family metalloprotein
MEIRTVNPEVYQAEGPVVWATRENIEFLKARALENPRGRARLCAHPNSEDSLHEMLVALRRDTVIRPHLHPNNVESVHMIEGLMTVVHFNEDGSLAESVAMGDLQSGRAIYYRMTRPLYHAWLPETEVVVCQEVTRGPFNRANTVQATWAPSEGPDGKLKEYLNALRSRVLKKA